MESFDHDRIEWAADQIWRARADRRTLDPARTVGDIDVADAYVLQGRLTARRLAAGERVVGWKLGYTSAAMRSQMGVSEPNFGPLTDAMVLASGDRVSDVLVQPRVEPEIALRFARDLAWNEGQPIDRDAVLAAVGSAHACLEIVHSTWTGYRFSLAQNTADGSSAAQVVLGPELGATDLAAVEVELLVDGAPSGRGAGADASGHPADGVVWLLARLAPEGLRRGDVVITGGLTAAAPLRSGGCVSARFWGGGMSETVEVSVSR